MTQLLIFMILAEFVYSTMQFFVKGTVHLNQATEEQLHLQNGFSISVLLWHFQKGLGRYCANKQFSLIFIAKSDFDRV